MRKVLLIASLFFNICANAQAPTTNMGTEFWVGYGHHQFMETKTDNSQDMTLYLSVSNLPIGVSYATVTVTIDSSGLSPALWWTRTYHINSNTTIDISNSATPAFSYSPAATLAYGPMPKGVTGATASHTSTSYDSRLYSDPQPLGTSSEGIFRKKGIHITSDYPIAAYAHIYGSVSSGATMLIPISNWGIKYTTINSKQADAVGAFNFFYVVATKDSTPIKIVPSQMSRLGKPANVPIYTTLQKGQIYQYVGQADAAGNGVELTGSTVESLDPTKPIAVFAGNGRTSGESSAGCSSSSRDNDMQQCFPHETWGLQYITVPFSTSNGTNLYPSVFSGTVYKIIARDSGTLVSINGGSNISIATNSAYIFGNSTPNYISANKPIAVAQFMTSLNCNTFDGDPEMIYLSSLDRGINATAFYRTTQQAITSNYLTLVVPDSGLSSLQIDGFGAAPYGGNYYSFVHPNILGYTCIVKGWTAAKTQCIVSCNKPFTGITYGLGGAESYGYSIGANFFANSPNNIPVPKPKITGIVFCDLNSNGVKDGNDFNKAYVKVVLSNGTYTFTNSNGEYTLYADSAGSYTTTIVSPNAFNAVPASISYNFSKNDTIVTTDIALQPTSVFDSLSVFAVPLVPNAVQSGAMPYWVQYENSGTTILSPTVFLNYSNYILNYDSCSDANAIAYFNGIATAQTNMQPGQMNNFIAYYTVKPTASIGDTLKTVYGISIGTAVAASDSFYMLVEGGISPNMQRASPSLTTAEVVKGKDIEYLINFQNRGTDAIKKITIYDTLSSYLQYNTLQITGSNYPCKMTVKNNVVKIVFDNIYLVDSATNKLKSRGFVCFKIKPIASLTTGTVITNKAAIYFDYNAPIVTNNATTIIKAVVTPVQFTMYDVRFTNGGVMGGFVANTWTTATETNTSHFNVQRSLNGKDFTTLAAVPTKGLGNYEFIDNQLPITHDQLTLYYRLEIVDKDGSKTYSEVKNVELGIRNLGLSVYPNPAKDAVTINCKGMREARVMDCWGRVVFQSTVNSHLLTMNTKQLPKGVYMVQVITNKGEVKNAKLVVE